MLTGVLVACGSQKNENDTRQETVKTEQADRLVKRVTIEEQDSNFHFMINGDIFPVKGVGLDFRCGNNFTALKEAGGNAFRTWSPLDVKQELDSAQKYGFMVALGLGMDKELHGFDYNDTVAVKKQFDEIKKVVDTYKDHPNLLCWVAGNELNLLLDTNGQLLDVNPKVYDAACDIIDYIHTVDHNHPVTFTFAGIMKNHIDVALKHCPNVDFLSFQVYAGLGGLPNAIKGAQINKPYVITEFGPTGHWEMPYTSWGREIEEPSGIKSDGIIRRIHQGLDGDKSGLCMGGFAFLWGQKQERTPTWYGMFHESGHATSTVDELTLYWTGHYPKQRAPYVSAIQLNDQIATDNIVIAPGTTCTAKVEAKHFNDLPMTYKWVIMTEVTARSSGGAHEAKPQEVAIQATQQNDGSIQFTAPTQAGEYRLFAYVYDGKKAGGANIPFKVE